MNHFANKMDRFTAEYYEQNGNSGVLRVTHKDTILYERFMGFSDRESQRPFTQESMFSF